MDEPDFGTLADLIRGHAGRQPRHTALQQDGRVLTYAEFDALMDRVATALGVEIRMAFTEQSNRSG